VNRTGIAWKYLPHDFPPHPTVYSYYATWRDEGIFAQLNCELTGLARVKAGRAAEPTAAVIDTQSVKTSTNPPTTTQGTDAAKKIVGRKRSVATDALGLLLAVNHSDFRGGPEASIICWRKGESRHDASPEEIPPRASRARGAHGL